MLPGRLADQCAFMRCEPDRNHGREPAPWSRGHRCAPFFWIILVRLVAGGSPRFSVHGHLAAGFGFRGSRSAAPGLSRVNLRQSAMARGKMARAGTRTPPAAVTSVVVCRAVLATAGAVMTKARDLVLTAWETVQLTAAVTHGLAAWAARWAARKIPPACPLARGRSPAQAAEMPAAAEPPARSPSARECALR